MTLPPIYPILDTASLVRRDCPPLEAAEAFLEAGASVVQFRHKDHWDRATFHLATQISNLCREANATFVVNDRADYARILNAALHVGQDDLLPADARTVLGPGAIIGLSTHNPAQMTAAAHEPVDYVAFGPIFPTVSKHRTDPQVGLEGLRTIRSLTNRQLVAIGGVTRDNALFCWGAGADSVAVIADLLPQPCSKQTIRDRMAEWIRLSAHAVPVTGLSRKPIREDQI